MASLYAQVARSLVLSLYSPEPRVYNLRLLLFSNAVALGLAIYFMTAVYDSNYLAGSFTFDWNKLWWTQLPRAFAAHIVVFIHHSTVVVLAFKVAHLKDIYTLLVVVTDLILIVLELYLLATFQDLIFLLVSDPVGNVQLHYLLGYIPLIYSGFNIIVMACLGIFLIFRAASGVKSSWRFLGGCTIASPPYSLRSVFMNRSVMRPLIRGESSMIIAPRAILINIVTIGVIGFAVYSIVLRPLDSQVYVRTLSGTQLDKHWSVPDPNVLSGRLNFMLENVLLNQPLPPNETNYSSSAFKVVYTATTLDGYRTRTCGSLDLSESGGFETSCSFGWNEIASMEFRAAIPDTGVPATMAALDVALMPWSTRRSYLTISQILDPQVRAARNSGQSLFLGINTTMRASLGWVKRELKTKHPEVVYVPHFMTLSSEPTQGESSLVIINIQPPRIIRTDVEYTDASVLDGITSVGGFWTFVDGIFSFLFGASVLYFGLGRRPLSALGFVHVFQRNQLVRNWNDDFPALRTEGGAPGSTSAGVVAFLRERLVDIDVVTGAQSDAATAAHGDSAKEILVPATSGDLEAGASPLRGTALTTDDTVSVPLLHAHDTVAMTTLNHSSS
ncbi:Short-chain dehydrogenase/reductase family protein [Mycena indigotica]|uniref:Short-chain dehydrogenase/reductase family protein n=1 Tax=Mycena indigotica TaxID=2126181 RepID=A0A8H6VVI3_9AGAR|nr:Short-chain dehydrogenase/reductase family protein [Mycena indigotica]KAF7289809.1 Short-chain dehydrogenase/reductase family protein [Mycena indigotica]